MASFNKPLRSLIWFMTGLLCVVLMAIASSQPVAAKRTVVSAGSAHLYAVEQTDGFQRVVASHLEPNFYN